MKYLVSALPEKLAVGEEERWAPAGEPVVPWFPLGDNVFVSATSFKKSLFAEVVIINESADVYLNKLLQQLSAEYPGIPATLHKQYVLKTAAGANALEAGTRVQPFIDETSVRLRVVGTEDIHVLWDTTTLQR